MDRGLWSWSRHPNYFGEFGFWFSLALFGVAASPGDTWWLFVGAGAMLAMFLGASIPMMEERSLERRPTTRPSSTGCRGSCRARPAGPRDAPAGGGRRTRRQRGPHRDPPRPARRRRRHLGQARAGERPGARHAADPPGRLGQGLLDPVRPVPPARPGPHRARHPDRARPGRAHRHGARSPTASTQQESYDVLVISTGVTNGFWRQPTLQIGRRHRRRPATRTRDGSRLPSRSSWSVVAPRRSAAPPTSRRRGRTSGSTCTSPASGPPSAPPAGVGAGVATAADRSGRRPAPRAPRGPARRLRRRRDHQRAGRLEHRPAVRVRRRGAVGDRTGTAEHRLAASGAARRRRLRPRHPGAAGSGPTRACSPSATSRPPTRCARPPATGPTGCSPATSVPSSPGRPLRPYKPPKGRWGSVLGVQHDGLRGVRPHGPGVPVPGVVGEARPARPHRETGDLQGSAAQGLTAQVRFRSWAARNSLR